ncbi:MAG: hypothetical protein WBX38_14215 [Candidatus Sulfotelmatobacter sp.]
MKIRSWFQILALGAAIGCVLTLLVATLWPASHGVVADAAAEESGTAQVPNPQSNAPQSSAPQSLVSAQTYEGVVTDTRCGAKHSAGLSASAADCTRMCVHAGEKFALVDGDKLYVLQGESAALKRAAGERVQLVGRLNGNTISVVRVGGH